MAERRRCAASADHLKPFIMQPTQSTTETEAGRTAALVGTGDLFGVWVPVAERMPRDRQRVLVAHLNGIHVWRAIATYWPAGTMDATMWDDPPDDWWDESGNRCVCPDAGWWEECFASDNAGMLHEVTHWMPLPPSPNGASEPRGDTASSAKQSPARVGL